MKNKNVLVTCGGKWVGVVLQLRQAMREVESVSKGRIIVSSMDPLTPAGCFADQAVIVPPIRDPGYVDALLDVCQLNDVSVVIPLIDLDLERLAPHLERFSACGITVVCPPPELVELCFDKCLFEQFTRNEGLNYPCAIPPAMLPQANYPLFYKLRRGFGSFGTGICTSSQQALEIHDQYSETIFQPLIKALEISVDAYITQSGDCAVCVPRIRDKVIAGEAYQSHTIAPGSTRDLTTKTIAALARHGLRGPLNIQMFISDPPCLIEVNTRIGSASVLSNMACHGRLYRAILHEATSGTTQGDPDDYIIGMGVYRYLGELFHQNGQPVSIQPGPER